MVGCPQEVQQEELILRNTYLNAQMGPIVQYGGGGGQQQRAIKWIDEGTNGTKGQLAKEGKTKAAIVFNHRKVKSAQLKSSIKLTEQQTNGEEKQQKGGG